MKIYNLNYKETDYYKKKIEKRDLWHRYAKYYRSIGWVGESEKFERKAKEIQDFLDWLENE